MRKKRKIAHITTIDGSLRFLLLDQMRSLQEEGYEVVGISAPGPDVKIVEAAGIRHIPVPMSRKMTPIEDLRSLWHLYKVMREEGFDLVHTHTPKPGLLGQIAARLAGVPVVVNTIHGFYFHEKTPKARRRFFILMEKIAALCSSIILSQNPEDMRTAVDEGICPPGKIVFLGNGIDLERFNPKRVSADVRKRVRRDLGFQPNDPVIGFVGRLVEEKGVLDLLRAARLILLKRPDARFLFVGPIDHEKRDKVTSAITKQFGVEHACVFGGERDDMELMYAAMDIFVLPSYREGFPRAAMEACAMGLPCVVTDVRGCREIVQAGRNGFLVPAGDWDALGKSALELLADPELAARMGREGRKIAKERFDQEDVFETVKNNTRACSRPTKHWAGRCRAKQYE